MRNTYPFATAVDAYFAACDIRDILKYAAFFGNAPQEAHEAASDHAFSLGCIVDDCLDAAIYAGSWPHSARFWGEGGV